MWGLGRSLRSARRSIKSRLRKPRKSGYDRLNRFFLSIGAQSMCLLKKAAKEREGNCLREKQTVSGESLLNPKMRYRRKAA